MRSEHVFDILRAWERGERSQNATRHSSTSAARFMGGGRPNFMIGSTRSSATLVVWSTSWATSTRPPCSESSERLRPTCGALAPGAARRFPLGSRISMTAWRYGLRPSSSSPTVTATTPCPRSPGGSNNIRVSAGPTPNGWFVWPGSYRNSRTSRFRSRRGRSVSLDLDAIARIVPSRVTGDELAAMWAALAACQAELVDAAANSPLRRFERFVVESVTALIWTGPPIGARRRRGCG